MSFSTQGDTRSAKPQPNTPVRLHELCPFPLHPNRGRDAPGSEKTPENGQFFPSSLRPFSPLPPCTGPPSTAAPLPLTAHPALPPSGPANAAPHRRRARTAREGEEPGRSRPYRPRRFVTRRIGGTRTYRRLYSPFPRSDSALLGSGQRSGSSFPPDAFEERTPRRREAGAGGRRCYGGGCFWRGERAGPRQGSLSLRPPGRAGVPGTRRLNRPTEAKPSHGGFRPLSLRGGKATGARPAGTASLSGCCFWTLFQSCVRRSSWKREATPASAKTPWPVSQRATCLSAPPVSTGRRSPSTL